MIEKPEPVIRLALVDDQTMVREGLHALLAQEPDLEIVAQATDVHALKELDVPWHVVVTELALSNAAPHEVIKHLRDHFDEAAIVVLTDAADLPTVQQVISAGANGYVLKSAAITDLLAAIRSVARGELYLQPSIGVVLASRPPEELAHPAARGLTAKETEVLRLLALGHTNVAIAHLLGSSLRTIETHRAHIYQELDLHTRAELVQFALKVGLLSLDEQDSRE